MPKSYDEIWGPEDKGHSWPRTWLVDTAVMIRYRATQECETVSVKMMSRNEWKERVKRVVALRYDLSEDSFDVVDWYVEDEDE